MVLVAGLCHDAGLPLALPKALQPAAVCEARGISYVAFAMWVAGLFQFTVAYSLLKPKARCHPSFPCCVSLLGCYGFASCLPIKFMAVII